MKKSLLFAAVLCGTLAAAPAMAEDVGADFHALSAMSSPVPAMTETQMSSVEGGLLPLDVSNLVDALFGLVGGLPVVGPTLGAVVGTVITP
jgi:hypothetical protein